MSSAKPGSTLVKKETKTTKANSKLLMNADSDTPKSSDTPKKSGCCMGTSDCASTNTNSNKTSTKPAQSYVESEHSLGSHKGPKTRIVIKFDVGFKNLITIRGKGAGLSWDRGLSLKNTKADEWVWETETLFTTGEFKVLINDTHYELGENHTLRCGASIQYIPKF